MTQLSIPEFQSIQRPVDRVVTHGSFDIPVDAHEKVMMPLIKGSRRSTKSRVLFHFEGSFQEGDYYNIVHLDMSRERGKRNTKNIRPTEILLSQDWYARVSKSDSDDIGRIKEFLRRFEELDIQTDLTCHVFWVFAPNTAEPKVPLSFPLPELAGTDMSLVRGMRLTNQDASKSMTIDLLPNGRLAVSLRFTRKASLGFSTLPGVIESGQSDISDFVKVR